VELRLCRGASWQEALLPVRRTAATAALTPIMNMLSAAGIVHIPGMMTGQILAGQAPYQAAAYQVLIFFLIAATSCTTVQTLMWLALHKMVDQANDRLQVDGIQPVGKTAGRTSNYFSMLFQQRNTSFLTKWKKDDIEDTLPPSVRQAVYLKRHPSSNKAILQAKDMPVDRTDMDITFDLHPSDRLGIQGASGIGKSQILRTLAGLEALNRLTVSIDGRKGTELSMPEWRRRVALVSQGRPSINITPRQFYEQAYRYKTQHHRQGKPSQVNGVQTHNPVEIAAAWDLPETAFDQPWSTLSGGESQRAALAIALALGPDVMLLDESTSALDEATTLKVEETLKGLQIPVIMVSHSQAQLDRFCNHRIDLGPNKRTNKVQAATGTLASS
jgi:ABC-type glutathione transport system ATPase component